MGVHDVALGQYRDCWCLVCIAKPSAVIIIYDGLAHVYNNGGILTTCAISIQENDVECKYTYDFFIIQARDGLILVATEQVCGSYDFIYP